MYRYIPSDRSAVFVFTGRHLSGKWGQISFYVLGVVGRKMTDAVDAPLSPDEQTSEVDAYPNNVVSGSALSRCEAVNKSPD